MGPKGFFKECFGKLNKQAVKFLLYCKTSKEYHKSYTISHLLHINRFTNIKSIQFHYSFSLIVWFLQQNFLTKSKWFQKLLVFLFATFAFYAALTSVTIPVND